MEFIKSFPSHFFRLLCWSIYYLFLLSWLLHNFLATFLHFQFRLLFRFSPFCWKFFSRGVKWFNLYATKLFVESYSHLPALPFFYSFFYFFLGNFSHNGKINTRPVTCRFCRRFRVLPLLLKLLAAYAIR